MAYECGYEGGYTDDCGEPTPPVVNVCAAVGWGGSWWAGLTYGGTEFCSLEADEQVVVAPRSNVRELCIVRCN